MMKSNPPKSLRAKSALSLIAGVLPLACMAPGVMGTAPGVAERGEQPLYDVVYGNSSGAVIAAIAAKREGRSFIFVNPTSFPGGMSASALGATDFLGRRHTLDGIASEFYEAIAAAWGTNYVRSFEPHVAKSVFQKMLADTGVPVSKEFISDFARGNDWNYGGVYERHLAELKEALSRPGGYRVA